MTDHLVELEALLPKLPEAVSQRRLGDQLANATEKLKGAPQQAAKLEVLLAMSAEVSGADGGDLSDVIAKTRRSAIELGESLSEAESEDSLREALWAYEKEFTPAMQSFDRAVRARVKAKAQNDYQPLIAYGALLGKIGATAELGARLTAFGQKAIGPVDQLQPLDLLEVVRRNDREFGQLQADRAALVGSDAVGAFLNALAERRATLDMVTPEVWTWLTENGALGQFSVTPA
jgi:hypothetical protein